MATNAPAKPAVKAPAARHGGLTTWEWVGVAALAFGVYYVYRRYEADVAANSTASTAGGTIPATVEATSASSAPSTLSQWIQAALGGSNTTATYTSSDLLNDITDWLAGQCVSQAGVPVLGNLVATLGTPPGYSTTPTITACSSTTTSTGSTGSTTTTTPAAQPGMGTATIDGQSWTLLGYVDQNGQYQGYNIGQGGPVYATWVGNGTPTEDFNIGDVINEALTNLKNGIAGSPGQLVAIWTPTNSITTSELSSSPTQETFPGYTGTPVPASTPKAA